MPAITPSYLYTFFAIIAVSGILLVSFMGYVGAIRLSSEMGKLKDLVDLVAAKATELISLAKAANTTAEAFIQAPATIGDRLYWLMLSNDSSRVWVEGGLGNTPKEEAGLRVYLPSTALAYGYYVSGYGAIFLKCSLNQNAGIPEVQLSSSSQNGG
ncbi:MAG: hypothetical protein QXN95_03490 [Candidatus Bathyarchaeia archaeon]